jgi:MFS family permease
LVDGLVSVALVTYLTGLGFRPFQVGAFVTGTLLGSAAVTLGVGLLGYRLSRRGILLGAAGLMVLTGLGFAGPMTFWPLMLVAVAGTLNSSSGDVSVFLPTEQAALAHTVSGPARTMVFSFKPWPRARRAFDKRRATESALFVAVMVVDVLAVLVVVGDRLMMMAMRMRTDRHWIMDV